MKKKNKAPSEEDVLKNKLREFSIEEIESYLELLLTKCLEAIENEDIGTYSEIEKTLNKSIIIFSSTVRNFNIIYNSIKLRVANKFLKKLLNNNSLSVLEDVSTKGSFLTVEEADKILKAEEYLKYTTAKNNLQDSLKTEVVLSNDRYSFISDEVFYDGTLIDKESKFHVNVELEGNSEIFKAFLTKDSALLTDVEKKLLNKELKPEEIAKEEDKLKKETYTIGLEEHISFRKKHSHYIEDTIYYNENKVFLTYVTSWGLVIYHKRTGSSVEVILYADSWFLMDLATYCIGKAGSLINEMEDPYLKKDNK